MSANPDRLYRLLPGDHRMRDADQGYPLQALLRVIAEQVNLVEDGHRPAIRQLVHRDPPADWAVPYIAELIGYVPSPADLASPGAGLEEQLRDRWITPRREVANTVRYRRRKGALVPAGGSGWRRGGLAWRTRWNSTACWAGTRTSTTCTWTAPAWSTYGRSPSSTCWMAPSTALARSVDIRRINSARTPGRANIPSVGVFSGGSGVFGD